MKKIPHTRFPAAVASSYAVQMKRMIDDMNKYTLAVLIAEVQGYADEYQAQFRQDGLLDLIEKAMDKARRVTEEVTFSITNATAKATSFFRSLNLFNRRNAEKQIKAAGAEQGSERWLQDFTAATVKENVGLIKSIHERYHTDVTNIVLQGVKNGRTIKQIARRIREAAGVTKRRAELIAEDQAGSINAQLSAIRNKEAGATGFIWRTREDNRVRVSHKARNGEKYTYDNPPDGELPGTPIRCRCEAEPIYPDRR